MAVIALLHSAVFVWAIAQLRTGARRRPGAGAGRRAGWSRSRTTRRRRSCATGHPSPRDRSACPCPRARRHGGVRVGRGGPRHPGRRAAPRRRPARTPARLVRPPVVDGARPDRLAPRPHRRDAGPPRPQRAAGAGAPRAARPARPAAAPRAGRRGARAPRTYRLGDPARMHFDEVYHARTAAEFLQDWRYGIDHDIYEWTHPHLAKYAMAAGIATFAGHDVAATGDLGVPVLDAAVEPRREDPGGTGELAGDRTVGRHRLRARRLRPGVAPGRRRGGRSRAPARSRSTTTASGSWSGRTRARCSPSTRPPSTSSAAVDPVEPGDRPDRRRDAAGGGDPARAVPRRRAGRGDHRRRRGRRVRDRQRHDRRVGAGAGGRRAREPGRRQRRARPAGRGGRPGGRGRAPGGAARRRRGGVPRGAHRDRRGQPPAAGRDLDAAGREDLKAAIDAGELPGVEFQPVPTMAVAGADGVTFLDADGAVRSRPSSCARRGRPRRRSAAWTTAPSCT